MKKITIWKEKYDDLANTHEISDDQLAKIEEILKPKSERWMPEIDSTYYFVDVYGNECTNIVIADWKDSTKCKFRLGQNNVFKTIGEAEKHAKYLQAISDVTNYCYDNDLVLEDIDWEDAGQRKRYIHYGNGSNKLFGTYTHLNQDCLVLPYLKSDEACTQVIDNMEKELKLIFDVE